jgi:hypothetical protein
MNKIEKQEAYIALAVTQAVTGIGIDAIKGGEFFGMKQMNAPDTSPEAVERFDPEEYYGAVWMEKYDKGDYVTYEAYAALRAIAGDKT